ncbi:actin-related protein 10-like [Dysidea avara]|uniref:actin-related protein 10-like n=1 Tax=Dysidea avara TaxID=196820 RepID=UPI00331DAAF3
MSVSSSSHRSSLLTDKGCVVIDIGHTYTKVGMSGEPAPRFIIRSKTRLKLSGKTVNVLDKELLWSPQKLAKVMTSFMKDIFLNYLLTNPKDSRVIIVESLVNPMAIRNALAHALFKQLNVSYVVFMPSHLLCTFAIGRQSALVVDVGYKETEILPIYEGIPVVNAWQVIPFAAEEVQSCVKQMITEKCEVTVDPDDIRPASTLQDEVIDAELENIIVKTCFVRSQDNDQAPSSIQYPFYSENFLLSLDGTIRSHSADVMFNPDDLSVQQAILESVLRCPRDCRKELCENLLIVGGGAMIPGFNYRLKQELFSLLEDKDLKYHSKLSISSFKFHSPPGQINCTQWLGGSIFGMLETAVLERAVTRERYADSGRLPDWLSPEPSLREELHAVKRGSSTPTMARHSAATRTKPPVQ